MMVVSLGQSRSNRSLYDFKDKRWTTVTANNQSVVDFSVCIALNRNYILITGGSKYQVPTNMCFKYKVGTR